MDEINYEEYFDKPLPNEDAKQYGRYLSYRNMNPSDRSMKAVTKILNNNGDDVSPKTIHNTGHRYKWAVRARAYDSHLSSVELQVLETSLAQAVNYTMEMEDLELVMLTKMVQTLLRKANKALEEGDIEAQPDAMDVQRITSTVETIQKLRRRRAGLPASYVTERVDEPDLEDSKFIIGG